MARRVLRHNVRPRTSAMTTPSSARRGRRPATTCDGEAPAPYCCMNRHLPRRQGGCCRRLLRLREENARFVLLAAVLLVYMILGALLFRAIEGPGELEARERYDQVLRDFWLKYNGTVDPEDVVRLLEEHGNASSRNLLPSKRPRWDFVGAFYFVGTVVSTIGE
ncbi:hypothetical protein HPB49_008002 [Dermacentor silvarum]|uniref:Uncharacterized protein n=1 Tax=Dermacentor silvarum TaxID=543639 RepID=A0ACB8C2N3_DERSI|nr:hypothetical protein HPB49_008002 [Dermacentor silvarum]